MRYLFFFLMIIAAGIFQAAVPDYLKVFGAKPDLLLIAAVLAGLTFRLPWALIFGVFSGLLKDAFAGSAFGVNTLLFPIWNFLIARLNKEIIIENNYMYLLLVFGAALIHNIASGLIFIYLGNAVPLGIFLCIAGAGSLYTALVLPLFFKLIKKMKN